MSGFSNAYKGSKMPKGRKSQAGKLRVYQMKTNKESKRGR